jgi:methionine-S-sulfoxide reductase
LFGAGCFWGVQYSFDRVKGVLRTVVGYSGGNTKDPTYNEVCMDRTGHAEVVLIDFDPDQVSYRDLLMHLFSIHDPTTKDRQGFDFGKQYRSSVMYFDEEQKRTAEDVIDELGSSGRFRSPIVTELVPAKTFYPAEDYHQKYNDKHGIVGCHF